MDFFRPALLALLACLVLSSHAAGLSNADASAFFAPGEKLSDTTSITVDGRAFTAAQGSAGSLFFFDDQSALVEDVTMLEALAQSLSLAKATGGNGLEAASSFNASLTSCKRAYSDFATDAHFCLEQTYLKYRCGFLWQTGLSEGILPFSITDAKKHITTSFSFLDAAVAALQRQLVSTVRSDSEVSGLLSLMGDSLSDFGEWHSKMVSYAPFASDGRLSDCKLSSSDLQALRSSLSAQHPDKVALLSSAKNSLAAARASPDFNRKTSGMRQAQYQLLALQTSKEFSNVRGLTPAFLFDDYTRISNALAALELNSSGANFAAYDSALTESRLRLELVRSSIPPYALAARSMQNASLLLASYPNSSSEYAAYSQEQESLSVRLSSLEDKMSSGKPAAAEAQALAADAAGFYSRVSRPGAAGAQSAFQLTGFTALLLGAVAVAMLVLAAFFLKRTLGKGESKGLFAGKGGVKFAGRSHKPTGQSRKVPRNKARK